MAILFWKFKMLLNRLAFFFGLISRHDYHYRGQQLRPEFDRLNAAGYWRKRNKRRSRGKIIYTCITGGYDEMLHHDYLNPDYDYICFTDNEDWLAGQKSGAWQMKPISFKKENPHLTNRYHKMMPQLLFPEAEESIYVDGNVNLRSAHVFARIDAAVCAGAVFAGHKHFARDCLYQEAAVIIEQKKDDEAKVKGQMSLFRKDNFPEKYGLHECNILYRRHHNPKVIAAMKDWWHWTSTHSRRDQLSFEYVCWKNKLQVTDLAPQTLRNYPREFVVRPHLGNRLHPALPQQESKFRLSLETTPKRLKINIFGLPISIKGDFRRRLKPCQQIKAREKLYWDECGLPLNLHQPQTLTEKINYLALGCEDAKVVLTEAEEDRRVCVYAGRGEVLLVEAVTDLQSKFPEQAIFAADGGRLSAKIISNADNFVPCRDWDCTPEQIADMARQAAEKSLEYPFAVFCFARCRGEFAYKGILRNPYRGFFKILPEQLDRDLGSKVKL